MPLVSGCSSPPAWVCRQGGLGARRRPARRPTAPEGGAANPCDGESRLRSRFGGHEPSPLRIAPNGITGRATALWGSAVAVGPGRAGIIRSCFSARFALPSSCRAGLPVLWLSCRRMLCCPGRRSDGFGGLWSLARSARREGWPPRSRLGGIGFWGGLIPGFSFPAPVCGH